MIAYQTEEICYHLNSSGRGFGRFSLNAMDTELSSSAYVCLCVKP
jgi:hypothetical protein